MAKRLYGREMSCPARRDAIMKALEPLCLLAHRCLQSIGMIEALEGDLKWSLHGK